MDCKCVHHIHKPTLLVSLELYSVLIMCGRSCLLQCFSGEKNYQICSYSGYKSENFLPNILAVFWKTDMLFIQHHVLLNWLMCAMLHFFSVPYI